MTNKKTPVTSLCTHTLTRLHYRDADLVEDLMGKKTFTEVMLMQILGREPRGVDIRITDVVLIVLMEHVAKKKDGTEEIKILPKCTLPLTGVGVISRIITDLCVLDITPKGLSLVELAPGVTKEEVISKTGAPIDVAGF